MPPSTLNPSFARHLGLILLFCFAFSLVTGTRAVGQEINEDQFKAAFLFNVAEFVEWPAGTFKGSSDPIVGCIYGASALGPLLERASNSNLVGTRRFVVRRIVDVQRFAGCHILFAGASKKRHWAAIVEETRGKGILTVGETEGFAAAGGVANFKRDGDRVRIQINLDAAESEKLRISSKLLSLSQIVKEKSK